MNIPTVKEFMEQELFVVTDDQTLRSAVELIRMRRIRHLPVVDDDGLLVGILTDRDVRRALPSPLTVNGSDEFEAVIDSTTVDRVMTREPITVHPDCPLDEAIKMILDSRIGCLPVVDNERLVGIFTETNIARAYLTQLAG